MIRNKRNTRYRVNKSFKRGWRCVRPAVPRPKPRPSTWDSPCGNYRVTYAGHIRKHQRGTYALWSLWYIGERRELSFRVKPHTVTAGTLRGLKKNFEDELGQRLPMKKGKRFGWEKWKMDGDLYYLSPDNCPWFIKFEPDMPEWQLWRKGGNAVAAAPRLRDLYIAYLTLRLEGKA